MKLNFVHKKAPKKFKFPRKIILLHGWAKTASTDSFKNLQEELAKLGIESWAIDLAGFGKSPAAPKHYGIPEYAEEIVRFIEDLSIKNESYFIFGHSFGGSLAAHIAANSDPKNIDGKLAGIILCNSAGIRYKTLKAKIALPFARAFKSLKTVLPDDIYTTLRRNIYYYFIRERDYVDTADKKEQFVRVTNDDITETFRQVEVPTLIIWGKDDKITPLSMGNKIHSLIEKSEMKIIDGRHGIPITRAREVAKLIADFVHK